MFDANQFKRAVKDWIRSNPEGTETDLVDFCEDQIPPHHYATHQWLIEHTVSWYRHILAQRTGASDALDEGDEATYS
jgi:hypothetical protein